jgi:hypothetical protein
MAGSRYSGALDYDHLCNCKDTNVTFPNLRVVANSMTPDQAVATVTFTGNDKTENRILINLTLEAGNWRISDIKDYTGPAPYISLRGLLKREIKAWSKVQPSALARPQNCAQERNSGTIQSERLPTVHFEI